MRSYKGRLLLTRYDFYNFGTHSATPACDCNFCSRCAAAGDRSPWVTGRWTIKCRLGLRGKSLQRHRRTAATAISSKSRFGSFGASATHCACLGWNAWVSVACCQLHSLTRSCDPRLRCDAGGSSGSILGNLEDFRRPPQTSKSPRQFRSFPFLPGLGYVSVLSLLLRSRIPESSCLLWSTCYPGYSRVGKSPFVSDFSALGASLFAQSFARQAHHFGLPSLEPLPFFEVGNLPLLPLVLPMPKTRSMGCLFLTSAARDSRPLRSLPRRCTAET